MDAEHHRKIELQSPEDLRYLIDNVTRRAREKIDLNLPPSAAPEGEDALRRRVEELVHDYVQKTFLYARQNISINGLDADSVATSLDREVEGFEPYDRRLHTRVHALHAQIEAATLSLSQLRREAPVQAANQYIETSKAGAAATAEAIGELNAKVVEAKEGEPMLVVQPLERQAEVEKTYGDALKKLTGLKSNLPATAAKLERARAAAEYVEKSR